MNVLSFFLVVLAVVCFAYEQFATPPRRSVLPLGLAFLSAGIIVQLVWHTVHVVSVH